MKYSQLKEEIQSYLNIHGQIEGSRHEQVKQAEIPCQKAIQICSKSDKLKLIKNYSDGYFYDIYATVVAQPFKIGYLCGDGTENPQIIHCHLDKVDEYGDVEITFALLSLVEEYFKTK